MQTRIWKPNPDCAGMAGSVRVIWMAVLLLSLPAIGAAQRIAIGEYPAPSGSFPVGITAGPDGALWFTEPYGIERVTTSGFITEYHVPTEFFGLLGIAAGPDGAL